MEQFAAWSSSLERAAASFGQPRPVDSRDMERLWQRGGAGRRGIEGAPPQEPLDRRKPQEDEIQRERELESSSHLVEKAAASECEADHLRHEEGRLEVRAGHSA